MYWENDKTNRYYRAVLSSGLVGGLVVLKDTGSLKTKRGRRIVYPVSSPSEGMEELDRLDKLRRKRGYHLALDPLELLMKAEHWNQ